MNIKEDGAATIIRRLRLRLLRKAFDFYVAGVNLAKKIDKDEERCTLYNRTRNERLCQSVFDAWHLFKKSHAKAKGYWYRIFLRLEMTLKQTAIKKWKEVTQKNVEMTLEQEQN